MIAQNELNVEFTYLRQKKPNVCRTEFSEKICAHLACGEHVLQNDGKIRSKLPERNATAARWPRSLRCDGDDDGPSDGQRGRAADGSPKQQLAAARRCDLNWSPLSLLRQTRRLWMAVCIWRTRNFHVGIPLPRLAIMKAPKPYAATKRRTFKRKARSIK